MSRLFAAKGFSLHSCCTVDHTTITALLVHHFHLHPSIDSIHNIILPTKMKGFHFTGFLITTVIDSNCQELLVLSNNPFPVTLNIVTARFTQAMQNCYYTTSQTYKKSPLSKCHLSDCPCQLLSTTHKYATHKCYHLLCCQ